MQQTKFRKKTQADGRARAYRLKYRYGITEEQYDTLLFNQGGCCAVCKKPAPTSGRRFAIDHNHRTRAIRGVLCEFCNYRLVGRHVSGGLLRAAADYLDKEDTGWFVPEKKKKRKRTR